MAVRKCRPKIVVYQNKQTKSSGMIFQTGQYKQIIYIKIEFNKSFLGKKLCTKEYSLD